MKLVTLLETSAKTKIIHCVLEFNQWLEPYIEFNTEERIEAEQIHDKDEKVLYKSMNNAMHGTTMENARNRIDVKLVNNEKYYIKTYIKTNLYVVQNI